MSNADESSGNGRGGNHAYREKCLEKHGEVCYFCEETEVHVHHIDGNPGHNDLANLIPVCASHHDSIHYGDAGFEAWTAMLPPDKRWVEDENDPLRELLAQKENVNPATVSVSIKHDDPLDDVVGRLDELIHDEINRAVLLMPGISGQISRDDYEIVSISVYSQKTTAELKFET